MKHSIAVELLHSWTTVEAIGCCGDTLHLDCSISALEPASSLYSRGAPNSHIPVHLDLGSTALFGSMLAICSSRSQGY